MLKLTPQSLTDQTSASVPNPPAGHINLYSEAGQLKYKKSDGTVITVT